MKPFKNGCCADVDGPDCEQTHVRARVEVKTEASNKIGSFSVSDIYQHGEQVHALRLEVIDEDGHNALLTLAPVQLEQIADWLVEKASQLVPAGDLR